MSQIIDFLVAFLKEVKWYLILVLFCISLISNELEHLMFMLYEILVSSASFSIRMFISLLKFFILHTNLLLVITLVFDIMSASVLHKPQISEV